MAYTEFTIRGGVNVTVRVTEIGDGNFRFDVAVVTEGPDYTGQIGELNGLWFNLPDEGAGFSYGDLSVTGVLDYQLAQDDVNKLAGGVNLSGQVLKENGGEFDAGVLIDQTGLAGQTGTLATSFVLSDASGTLTLADFTTASAEQYFGVRLTSVGSPNGARNGSLKLGSAPGDDIVDDTPAPVHMANDDLIFAFEDAAFGEPDYPEAGATVLANDTTDDGPYLGMVVGATVGQVVAGSDGGLMIIYADGSVDFSANGEFSYLEDSETARTTFTYGIEGGDVAIVTVEVAGFSDGIVG